MTGRARCGGTLHAFDPKHAFRWLTNAARAQFELISNADVAPVINGVALLARELTLLS